VFHDPNLAIEQQYIQHRDFAKEHHDAASVLSLVAMTSKPFIAQSAPIPNGYTMSTSQQRFRQLEPGKATILAWNCSVTVRLKSRSRRIGTVSAEFLK